MLHVTETFNFQVTNTYCVGGKKYCENVNQNVEGNLKPKTKSLVKTIKV